MLRSRPEKNTARYFLLLIILSVASVSVSAQSKAITLFQDAESARNSGNLELATELYKASLQENDRYREPYIRLAELSFYQNASEEALAYADIAAMLGQKDPVIQVLRGRILTELGRFTEAEEVLRKVLEEEPYNLNAFRAMGELEIARGSLRGAIVWYERALEIDPENRIALLSMVPLHDSLDRRDNAENLIIRAVELYPESFDVHLMAARHYLERGDMGRSEYHCDVALRIEPDNRDATLLYAAILSRQGRFQALLERIGSSSPLIRLPDDYLSFYLEGSAKASLGRYQEALDAFSAVLRIRPEDQITRIVYEQILSDKTDRSEPRNASRIAEAVDYHLDRAASYRSGNRINRALEQVRRALRIDAESVAARKLYAELWRLKGYPAKHLSILEVLERDNSLDTDTRDTIEIYRHELSDSVSGKWGINQFSQERFCYSIPVYISSDRGSMLHSLSREELAAYSAHVMHGYEHLSVPEGKEVASFAESYGRARALSAHYFAILTLHEDERSFTLSSELYSGNTGAIIAKEQIYRTGNERVTDAFEIWAGRIAEALPPLGRVIRYSFSEGLIDLGTLDGIEEGNSLLIIPKDSLLISRGSLGIRFNPEDAVGTIDITGTDELLSEGDIASTRFYDLINPGDWVVKPGNGEGESSTVAPGSSSDRGMPFSDIYKSVSNIR